MYEYKNKRSKAQHNSLSFVGAVAVNAVAAQRGGNERPGQRQLMAVVGGGGGDYFPTPHIGSQKPLMCCCFALLLFFGHRISFNITY